MRGIDMYDIVAVAGIALVAAGLALVWMPLALVVPGCMLLAFGVWGAR